MKLGKIIRVLIETVAEAKTSHADRAQQVNSWIENAQKNREVKNVPSDNRITVPKK